MPTIFGPPNPLKEKVCLVYDDGYSVSLAIDLSKIFKKVYYFCNWKSTKPIVNDYFIGYNIPEIERVDNIFEHIEEVDIFIFSAIYNGDLQEFLEKKCGKLVSGSRKAEMLEIDRVYAKKLLKQLDLPVTKYEVIKGTEELHKYLQENTDVYVKINGKFRTLFETFHSDEYVLAELQIDEIEGELGAIGDEFEFIVEEAIPDSVEVGLELITANGQYAKKNIVGIEIKDKGYIGRIMDRCDIPEEITLITDKLAPIFKAYGYKGPYSDEIRVTKDRKSYMLDFCCREPIPPGYLRQYLYKNYGEMLYHAAMGQIIEPEFDYEYGCELIMNSRTNEKNFIPIIVPDKYKNNVKLNRFMIHNNIPYVIPNGFLGSIVYGADTLEDAINGVKEIAESIKCPDIDFDFYALERAKEQVEKLEEFGINFFK